MKIENKTKKENTMEVKSNGKDESNKQQAEYSLKLNILFYKGRCIKTNCKVVKSEEGMFPRCLKNKFLLQSESTLFLLIVVCQCSYLVHVCVLWYTD